MSSRESATECHSVGPPSREEYWHIRETRTRLRNSIPPNARGVCSSDMRRASGGGRLVAQAVEHDVEQAVDLLGLGPDRREAAEQAGDRHEIRVGADGAHCLRALQQRLAG